MRTERSGGVRADTGTRKRKKTVESLLGDEMRSSDAKHGHKIWLFQSSRMQVWEVTSASTALVDGRGFGGTGTSPRERIPPEKTRPGLDQATSCHALLNRMIFLGIDALQRPFDTAVAVLFKITNLLPSPTQIIAPSLINERASHLPIKKRTRVGTSSECSYTSRTDKRGCFKTLETRGSIHSRASSITSTHEANDSFERIVG